MTIVIRPGDAADIPTILAMLDRATEWLVAQGRTGQWGDQPHSTDPRRVAQAAQWADSGGIHLAEQDGQPVGALVINAAPSHHAADEPELYVNLLVTDRRAAGQDIGGALLRHARTLAQAAGIALLRVDCYAADDGKLASWYESQGFRPVNRFTVDGDRGPWPGLLLEQRIR